MATVMKRRSDFGQILRAELDAQDISVRELARRLVASGHDVKVESCRRALMRYISGDSSPGADARVSIAAALGIPVDAFTEDRERQIRHERVMDALAPLADVLLELAVEVGRTERVA